MERDFLYGLTILTILFSIYLISVSVLKSFMNANKNFWECWSICRRCNPHMILTPFKIPAIALTGHSHESVTISRTIIKSALAWQSVNVRLCPFDRWAARGCSEPDSARPFCEPLSYTSSDNFKVPLSTVVFSLSQIVSVQNLSVIGHALWPYLSRDSVKNLGKLTQRGRKMAHSPPPLWR